MFRVISADRYLTNAACCGILVCLAAGATPAYGQDEPASVTIPTVYCDSYKITISGKPDATGTFSMVLKPHGENGTEFTGMSIMIGKN